MLMLGKSEYPVSVQNFINQDGNRAFGYRIDSYDYGYIIGFYTRITSDGKLEKIELDADSVANVLFPSDHEQYESVYEFFIC